MCEICSKLIIRTPERPATTLKNEIKLRCFPMNYLKLLRLAILQDNCERQVLHMLPLKKLCLSKFVVDYYNQSGTFFWSASFSDIWLILEHTFSCSIFIVEQIYPEPDLFLKS